MVVDGKATLAISVEHLFHFRCFSCQKWWTVGDWIIRSEIVCPHCGERHITKNADFDEVISHDD